VILALNICCDGLSRPYLSQVRRSGLQLPEEKTQEEENFSADGACGEVKRKSKADLNLKL